MKSNTDTSWFSWQRTIAIILKEFIQMRRDRVTFAIMIVIPLIQLTIFGFAINTNPKQLPTAIVAHDNSPFVRALVRGMENTGYFRIASRPNSSQQAHELLASNQTLFVLTIPSDFSQKLVRGQHPSVLLESDAANGVAIGNALFAMQRLSESVFNPLFTGKLTHLQNKPPAFSVINHQKYNPENITSLFIVPGLLGVVLTMTMVMITSLAITRERERGTMESLLSTTVQPLEVMIGKISPYIVIGYVQVIIIILFAKLLFHVPTHGSMTLLFVLILPFIFANLAVGLTFSSVSSNQLQSVQLAFFFFLPSILLSGFMFPFEGMPTWAQAIGEVLPLTHFLRIVRGILLKGNGIELLWPDLLPLLAFTAVVMFIGIKRYRSTLD